MATSKLLKPTNVTISIPEFTDQPDQRVNSNCIDKEADAINSLSEQIENDYTSFSSGNMQVTRFGRVVYLKIGGGAYTASADTAFATVPTGFRPALDADFLDSYNKKRIQVKTDGSIVCTEALSATIIRGTVCYLTPTT